MNRIRDRGDERFEEDFDGFKDFLGTVCIWFELGPTRVLATICLNPMISLLASRFYERVTTSNVTTELCLLEKSILLLAPLAEVDKQSNHLLQVVARRNFLAQVLYYLAMAICIG